MPTTDVIININQQNQTNQINQNQNNNRLKAIKDICIKTLEVFFILIIFAIVCLFIVLTTACLMLYPFSVVVLSDSKIYVNNMKGEYNTIMNEMKIANCKTTSSLTINDNDDKYVLNLEGAVIYIIDKVEDDKIEDDKVHYVVYHVTGMEQCIDNKIKMYKINSESSKVNSETPNYTCITPVIVSDYNSSLEKIRLNKFFVIFSLIYLSALDLSGIILLLFFPNLQNYELTSDLELKNALKGLHLFLLLYIVLSFFVI
jgi:hypothetical protein